MKSTQILTGKHDMFRGIEVDLDLDITVDQLDLLLRDSLASWTEKKYRGIWISVPISKSEFIPLLVKYGFVYHHAKPTYLMLIKWLPTDEPNNLPTYPHTSIGVGGFVLNDKNELLVIKERWHKDPLWKLPGGMVDLSEDISAAAIREVWEETSIKTEFISLICFRHCHQLIFDTSNFYFIVRLKPLTTEIKKDDGEIFDAKWIPFEEYLTLQVTPLNEFWAKMVKENQEITNGKPSEREMGVVYIDNWNKKTKNAVFRVGSSL